jgi:hypothetical protein
LQKKIPVTRKWTQEIAGVPGRNENVTLATFIRNKVHHPENQTMRPFVFSDDELKNSIVELLAVVKNP